MPIKTRLAKGSLAEIKENADLENFAGSSVKSGVGSYNGPEDILSGYSQLSDLSSTSGLEP